MTVKDIISRDLLKRLTTDFARHLLGLEAETVEVLETQNQRVEDRRADLVARMRGTDGEAFLLHIEIANTNVSNMPLRMLRYYTDIRLAGHAGPIRQFLIYIGADPLTMPAGLAEPGLLDYRYGLVDMHQIDCTGLQTQVEEAEHMLTEIDIESLPSFNIGFERGEEKGEEKGREEGEAQVVRRLLSRLGVAEASELLGLSVEDVKRMAAAGGSDNSGRDRH